MSVELSVIIPSFNTGAYIGDAVESIVNDIPDAEIIVVDDGSTDDTLDNLAVMDADNLTVIPLGSNTPGGAGIPSNIGIEQAQGKYIAFLDSDDFFYKGYLSTQLEQIKSSGADICVASYQLTSTITHSLRPAYDNDRWQRVLSVRPPLLNKDLYLLLSPEPWRKVYRASLFEDPMVRFPENGWFNEDYPFHWYCGLAAANGIVYCDLDTYFHRIDRVGQTTEAFDRRVFQLFDNTQVILDFIKSNSSYAEYNGHLLYWLVIGSWKLKFLKEEADEYFRQYKTLLQSFDKLAVSKFQKMSVGYYRRIFKIIINSDSLDELLVALHWDVTNG